jgi:hypothetical protein
MNIEAPVAASRAVSMRMDTSKAAAFRDSGRPKIVLTAI